MSNILRKYLVLGGAIFAMSQLQAQIHINGIPLNPADHTYIELQAYEGATLTNPPRVSVMTSQGFAFATHRTRAKNITMGPEQREVAVGNRIALLELFLENGWELIDSYASNNEGNYMYGYLLKSTYSGPARNDTLDIRLDRP